MVIMEGMTEGVIPMSTDVGGISEYITHQKNGLLIPNFKNEQTIIESFYEGLVALSVDEMRMRQLSETAFYYGKLNFSIEKFNAEYRVLFGLPSSVP